MVTTPVTSMLPANGAVNQSLPLTLSWVPGLYTESYDLYVWDSSASQPSTPYKTNLSTVSFTIPQNAFTYNTTYKWRLVSRNPCNMVSGPIQTFRLIPLPDLTVTNVLAPATAISGQTISLSWTVKNVGLGRTPANKTWTDAVYLSFDTLPNFSISPQVNPAAWAITDIPLKALVVANKPNVSSLLPGEQYSNTVDFTLPLNYQLPLYLYVVTNSGSANERITEVTLANDTARKSTPIIISLAPSPDLRVDSMFTPATVFSGSQINVTYKVKNYGVLTPAGKIWQDQVYLSQSILFDSATAIKLNQLTFDGSYYPNAPKAAISVGDQLQQDSSYTRTISTVIPNELFGQWFIFVKTNNTKSLYEGASYDNNLNYNSVQIYLTPTPQLKVQNLSLPITQASTTQPIGVNYNIFNEGFWDHIEKNRAKYFRQIGSCNLPCPPTGNSQYCVCADRV